MIRTAAEVADGLLGHAIYSLPWIRQTVLPSVARGLAQAGRERSAFHLCLTVCCAVGKDRAAARRAAAATIAFYATVNTYEPLFAAFGEEYRRIQAAVMRGDTAEMVDAVSRRDDRGVRGGGRRRTRRGRSWRPTRSWRTRSAWRRRTSSSTRRRRRSTGGRCWRRSGGSEAVRAEGCLSPCIIGFGMIATTCPRSSIWRDHRSWSQGAGVLPEGDGRPDVRPGRGAGARAAAAGVLQDHLRHLRPGVPLHQPLRGGLPDERLEPVGGRAGPACRRRRPTPPRTG